MALAKDVAAEYFRLAGQQQVLYAYWLSAGDVARARLAMDVVNWYYTQLGIPLYLPTDLPGYSPHPTTPDAAVTIAASLPVVSATSATSGSSSGSEPGGSSGSGSGFKPHFEGGTAPNGGGEALQEYCAYFPDDPICSGQGFTFYGGGGEPAPPVYVSTSTTIVINQEGLTLADVSSRISGALASAAAAIATAVDSVLGVAIAGIQHALNAIGNELASVYRLLSRLIGKLLDFMKALLLGVIHGLVAAVDAIGKMLKDVFAHGIMPALQALQKARDYLLKIYERYLRPLLIVLQDLRKVLAILKAFHIGFATKLDNALADIQSKISTPLLYLLRYTNAVANVLNLILDARLFIQRPLFLASANASKGSLLNLLINSMNPTPDPAAIAALQAKNAIPDPGQAAADFDNFLTSGAGPLKPTMTGASEIFQFYLDNGVN